MSKKTASTKQTSGSGFTFEEKVGAHFAMWMLLGGQPLIPRQGRVIKIEFQKRVDRYYLDDLVLTLEDGDRQWTCCLSVKSNTQFSQSTAPKDFGALRYHSLVLSRNTPYPYPLNYLGIPICKKGYLEFGSRMLSQYFGKRN